VLRFLPVGCVRDERFEGGDAGLWRFDDAGAYCRGLRSNLWLGSPGTAAGTHFDLSHNLFFQASGEKRFRLLPPAAHRSVRLHPRWHGSHLAAQHEPSDAQLVALGGYEVRLQAGGVLYLPPGWFHRVESISPNVGLNVWTDSLAVDLWYHVSNTSVDHAARAGWPALLFDGGSGDGGTGNDCSHRGRGHRGLVCLLGRARKVLTILLHHALAFDEHAPRRSLAEEAAALLDSRYGSVGGWDSLPGMSTAEARQARAAVADACASLSASEEPIGVVEPEVSKTLESYAASLRMLTDTGLRTLLLDELLEEFSRFALREVASTEGAADAAVATFLHRCLAMENT
jgi:hypothetical protein